MPPSPLEEWHHYLPDPDRSAQRNLYLTSVGRSTVRPGERYPRQTHPRLYDFTWAEGRTLPEYQILLITAGRGTFESKASGPLGIEAGQAMILFPDVWHRYRPNCDTGWTEKWMQFDGPLAEQIAREGLLTPSRPIVTPVDFRGTENLLDRMLQTIHSAPTANTLQLSLEAIAIIASIARGASQVAPRYPGSVPGAADAIVVAALDYIWTRGRNVLGVPEVASAIGVTRRTLERHMLTTLGHGVLDEIINCRFSRAERLLRSTTLPLKVVVHVSGFGSMENMRKVFIARTGLSPLAYRRGRAAESAPP